ncbi:mevalonate kinase-like isoform X2 [Dendronephthya gigantea]|uniref:mevalonate kinase-like isoform X2 n=1 Tax=Dendronephthya gigantea TaxID=151771 RepID=UPI00106ADF24|nr:mevalonate kinase-like isoform X2 [Dendronephthya gigantea]
MADFSSLVVSAPGKVILHGEHAVVYGKVSLAASVDLRTTLTWEKLTNNTVELHLHNLGFSSSWTTDQLKNLQLSPSLDVDAFKIFLGSQNHSEVAFTAVHAFVYLYRSIYDGSSLPGKFSLKSDIPVGAGLGSSASYCTVLATAMLVTSNVFEPEAVTRFEPQSHSDCSRDKCLRMISDWAYKAEQIIHGTPSGIDNTVSTYGGFLQFQSGHMENIRTVQELNIFLVNSNIPRSTKTMVDDLRQRYQEGPQVYDHLFNAINDISVECRKILEEQNSSKNAGAFTDEKDDFIKLQKLIDLNQDILRTIGVSHPVIDKVCEITLGYGLHSKLTGAGGGGCLITLLNQAIKSDTLDKLQKDLKELGCDSWKTKLGGNGMTIDKWTHLVGKILPRNIYFGNSTVSFLALNFI